jgi:hypothetical protein
VVLMVTDVQHTAVRSGSPPEEDDTSALVGSSRRSPELREIP